MCMHTCIHVYVYIYIYIHMHMLPPYAPTFSYLYRKIPTKNRLSWAGGEATNTFQLSGPDFCNFQLCNLTSGLPYFPTFQLPNFPTFQLSNFPTFQLSNIPTFQLSNFPTFQHSNFFGPNFGILESKAHKNWKVGMLESSVRNSWKVGELGRKKLESWKVKPKNIGQKLESQHIRHNISTSTNTSTHDEYSNCSGIMLFYILSLIGVLVSNQ